MKSIKIVGLVIGICLMVFGLTLFWVFSITGKQFENGLINASLVLMAFFGGGYIVHRILKSLF